MLATTNNGPAVDCCVDSILHMRTACIGALPAVGQRYRVAFVVLITAAGDLPFARDAASGARRRPQGV